MNKSQKFIQNLNSKERRKVLEAVSAIQDDSLYLYNFDLKKMKGNNNLFRIRIGRIRIIFSKIDNNETKIIFVGLRSDTTYKINSSAN